MSHQQKLVAATNLSSYFLWQFVADHSAFFDNPNMLLCRPQSATALDKAGHTCIGLIGKKVEVDAGILPVVSLYSAAVNWL